MRIWILVWDFPVIFGTDREFPLFYGLMWKPHRRIELCYDNTHPVGACHHQKFVVIDNAIAFCGGIDLTQRRWDTCGHQFKDGFRNYQGAPYPPFHDVMLMVQGEIAAVLTGTQMERSKSYGRLRFSGPSAGPSLRSLVAQESCRGHRKGYRRRADTDRAFHSHSGAEGHPATKEIEALYVDMIRNAQRLIYIENQYFTSQAIGDAVLARLQANEGPEIVIVVRQLSHGWLEALTMENLRTALLQKLTAADHGGRLHVYYPYIAGLEDNTCIDVHSKLMIVDDEWLRIGSANSANRSMGLDTECDLTIEARENDSIRQFIRSCRWRLLAEHLDSSPKQIEEAARNHSMADAIERLRRPERTLKELEIAEVSPAALEVTVSEIQSNLPYRQRIPLTTTTAGDRHAGAGWGEWRSP